MKERIAEKAKSLKSVAKKASRAASISFAAGVNMVPVFAAGELSTAENLVGTMIYYVCLIFQFIGLLLAVWSVGQLVLAFKNEDADSKSRAIMLLVVSCILIAIKTIVNAVVKASGMNITIAPAA